MSCSRYTCAPPRLRTISAIMPVVATTRTLPSARELASPQPETDKSNGTTQNNNRMALPLLGLPNYSSKVCLTASDCQDFLADSAMIHERIWRSILGSVSIRGQDHWKGPEPQSSYVRPSEKGTRLRDRLACNRLDCKRRRLNLMRP